MKLIDDLLESVQGRDFPVKRVCVGLHWTAVESRFVGMAHTYKTRQKVEITDSGNLVGRSALELAQRLRSWQPLEASLGLASLNSLIEPRGEAVSVNDIILKIVPGKRIAVVGRFPFNDQLERLAGRAYFFEMEPGSGELPSFAAEDILPQVEVAVITATALINKSLPRLMELSRQAFTIILGPSTPMNAILIEYGADVIAGIRVVEPDQLIDSLMQGVKKFRKIKGIEPISYTTCC